jgi:2-oxoglutarate dehydrogenase E2 component (dihydrolipoamide succinyltransferase)
MKVEVIMPQMGESIQEGTVVRWLKKVGDRVKRDEPILEISTDKVDAEIPSPAAGVLSEIAVGEGKTVEIKSVLGSIETEAGASASAPQSTASRAPEAASAKTAPAGEVARLSPAPAPSAAQRAGIRDAQERSRTRSSPLVRRIAKERNIDITELSGTGISGRVTKKDIQAYLEGGGGRSGTAASPASAPRSPLFKPGERVRVEPLSVMRRKISEHMVASKRTSAHVHSFFEVDYSAVDRIRAEKKAAFQERHGVKLTYLPFILHATVEALKAWPVLNASVDGDDLVYKQDIHLGVAVALEWGLIVPVIKNAEEKNLAGLARATADLAERARTKKLLPEEVQGGTFTITNPGVFGSLFGTPIINQPQLGILGVGTIERRLKVIEDAIAIRTMGYLAIGFDHRIVDGAVADQFMAHIKRTLENFDPRLV